MSERFRHLVTTLKWVTIGLLGGAATVLVTGAIIQSVLTSLEWKAHPPPGPLIDIGEHRLHIHCQGPPGASPTVILDAGGTAFSAAWGFIKPEVAKLTRVCSYDRAGLGWSEPGPPPRNAETAAHELHTLLLRVGELGPYVLVGHSYGGIVIRKYFDLYPEDVSGLVFVDTFNPKQRSIRTQDELARAARSVRRLYWMSELSRFGFLRLLSMEYRALPAQEHKLYDTISAWPSHVRASADELAQMPQSFEDPDFESQDFGDRPMIVLSENTSPDREIRRFKIREHRRLAQRSGRGIHIVVDGASHTSFVTKPEHAGVVVTAIREVITILRKDS